MSTTATPGTDSAREKALQDYRKKLLEHKELESRLKESKTRLNVFSVYNNPYFSPYLYLNSCVKVLSQE